MLSSRSMYLRYYIVNAARQLLYSKIMKKRRPLPKTIAGKTVMSSHECNEFIKKSIISGHPFMAGRFGSTEQSTIVKCLSVKYGFRRKLDERTIHTIYNYSGFFPCTQLDVMKFSELMLSMTEQVDLLGVWSLFMEDYIVQTYMPQAKICGLGGLEPYGYEEPWSKALAGKKVLVIHPFEQTILRQYEKRKLLFENPEVLPEFELKTIKAVQTIAGEKSEFKDWFEALDYMYNRAKAIDFDVAIVGCGAYGFPLSAMIKKMGKQVVHMGGSTQILFGIKGSRWEKIPSVSKLYNEHWVKPDQSETPRNSSAVEGGCYW